ncbi:hypothetical protein MTR_1g052415 [Medicago truncatula]|uniref:Uncharacterized protein n=1 Tax=Medicago truncatula TaxID=3880 RepID=A0A072VHR6_MEDTR|nr:hypothetical protein MTR_1g052415 [Medicago truncatula]
MLVARFIMSCKNHKSSTCLVGVREKLDESLSSFMDCFNDETTQIEDLNQDVALYPLMDNVVPKGKTLDPLNLTEGPKA